MKSYIGIKKIEAKPMTRGAYNDYRGWIIPENENPADEGYVIEYYDGYVSWSPKKQFEEAYHEIGVNPLSDTALFMVSADYKERFIAEYTQTVVRFTKLESMLNKLENDELDFIPACPKGTYNFKIRAMRDYITCLETRAVIEGIVLPKVNAEV